MGGEAPDDDGSDDGAAGAVDTAPADDDDDDDADGSDDDDDDGTGDDDDDDDDDDDGTGDDDDDDDAPVEGCPDTLPDGWLFCEDFDDIDGLGDSFSTFSTAEGRFDRHEGTAASGNWSMRLQHQPPMGAGGWVGVLFDPPFPWSDGPTYAGQGPMDDLYVQVKMRTNDGWPGASIGRSFRVASLADGDWTMPFQASIDVPNGSEAMRISAFGCDDCMGLDDWMNHPLVNQPPFGATPLFGAVEDASWRCIEFQLRLNQPDEPNAEIHLWIDGDEDIAESGFDWRGGSTGGWSYVAISNAWPGGVMPIDGELFYDDLIIATEPIGGC